MKTETIKYMYGIILYSSSLSFSYFTDIIPIEYLPVKSDIMIFSFFAFTHAGVFGYLVPKRIQS